MDLELLAEKLSRGSVGVGVGVGVRVGDGVCDVVGIGVGAGDFTFMVVTYSISRIIHVTFTPLAGDIMARPCFLAPALPPTPPPLPWSPPPPPPPLPSPPPPPPLAFVLKLLANDTVAFDERNSGGGSHGVGDEGDEDQDGAVHTEEDAGDTCAETCNPVTCTWR